MTQTVRVTKYDWRGRAVYSWDGEIILSEPGHVLLRAVWHGPGTIQIAGDVTFATGDIFYEHYYDQRPYGLWQVFGPDEQTMKCWYCNISTPAAFGDGTISFRDLLLDVLIFPDGSYRVLDRDDLERARMEGLDPTFSQMADDGAHFVIERLEQGLPPFGTR